MGRESERMKGRGQSFNRPRRGGERALSKASIIPRSPPVFPCHGWPNRDECGRNQEARPAGLCKKRLGGSMAAEGRLPGTSTPNDDVIVVSDEALLKAESFVEAEEGAANRLMGWPGRISTAIAVVMSLFLLYP